MNRAQAYSPIGNKPKHKKAQLLFTGQCFSDSVCVCALPLCSHHRQLLCLGSVLAFRADATTFAVEVNWKVGR